MIDSDTDSGGPDSYIDFRNLKIVGRDGLLNGTINIIEPLDDEACSMEMELASSPTGDGNFKTLPFGYKKSDCCQMFKKIYPVYVQPSLVDKSDMPHVEEDEGLCPFPAGEYWFKDVKLDTESWPKQVPRGIVRIRFYMYKNDVKTHTTTLMARIDDA